MEQEGSETSISVVWRGKKYVVEINSNATLQEFGNKLQKLTSVKADTMRLIVPQASDKTSKLLSPFSDEHSRLSLQEISILNGKSIRMMGASEVEVDEVIQSTKADLRIAGFDEEEKRIRQRMLDRPQSSLKLPQGTYIFCDFRTLQLPGIVLNPPPSEALKRMHMLAADPGIVAIMNKHRWRVGIMTEMAPVGYVGVSPKCLLGFNKNQGEEISLRLRTDDLKGFRKYDSIKKTLLHELAHMIYSEHDANFYALDKQLNQEAATLDWTRSRSHTLSGSRHSERYEEEFDVEESSNFSQKLGGKTSDQLASARASSVAAAYSRFANAHSNSSKVIEAHEEPDPDDSGFNMHRESELMETVNEEKPIIDGLNKAQLEGKFEPDENHNLCEPDPDDYEGGDTMESEPYSEISAIQINSNSYSDDFEMTQVVSPTLVTLASAETSKKPDHGELKKSLTHNIKTEPASDHSEGMEALGSGFQPRNTMDEPDPEDSETQVDNMGGQTQTPQNEAYRESDSDSEVNAIVHGEPDPDDQELQRIQDPVAVICNRLKNTLEKLHSEVNPTETTTVLQTLFKIIRNVIEHPNEMKFKRLRKANPAFQRNVANYKAAMEILFLIGFNEDVVLDEIGKAETYLVLKRNDPGLLWLAKSSLETCFAY